MGSLGGGNNGESISLYLLLDEEKDISNDDIKSRIIELTNDLDSTITVSPINMDMSALVGSGIEVIIKGKEIDTLHQIASDMTKLLEETEGIEQVDDGIEENLTEIRIQVDKVKAMENGLTVAQVFSHINSIIGTNKTATILSTENRRLSSDCSR